MEMGDRFKYLGTTRVILPASVLDNWKTQEAINRLPKYPKEFRQAIFTFVFIHQVAFYVICVAAPLYNCVVAGFAKW